MPVKKPPRVPEFRLHKATGQGYVVLNGQAVYLGRWDRPETEQRYHLLIATWLAAGGKRPPEPFLTGRLSCVRVANVRAHGQETADGPVDGFPEDGVVAQAAGAVAGRKRLPATAHRSDTRGPVALQRDPDGAVGGRRIVRASDHPGRIGLPQAASGGGWHAARRSIDWAASYRRRSSRGVPNPACEPAGRFRQAGGLTKGSP